jgi:ankyrin repeat protein
MVAAARGHVELAQLLIENGAELNHTAKYQLSALMLAVINSHIEIVQALVIAGADQSIRGTGAPGFAGLTAQELAEKAGYEKIAALLQSATPTD